MSPGLRLLPVLGLFLYGCAWNAAGQTGCQPVRPPAPLPDRLHESSGVAHSRTHPGILWTHNDGGEAVLWALDTLGALVARIPFQGGRMWDWEDLAVADCPAGSCLYLADTGDNQEVRDQVRILRLPEPDPWNPDPRPAESFPARLPDGARDVEAIFVLPGEGIHLVTKGRRDPVTVYRYPLPLRSGQVVTLEAVQVLSESARPLPAQITGADASEDGRLVAIRSYEAVFFYAVEGDGLRLLDGGRVALGTLQEPQGEAVGFGPEGQVYLTTEAGNFGGVAALRVLACPELRRE